MALDAVEVLGESLLPSYEYLIEGTEKIYDKVKALPNVKSFLQPGDECQLVVETYGIYAKVGRYGYSLILPEKLQQEIAEVFRKNIRFQQHIQPYSEKHTYFFNDDGKVYEFQPIANRIYAEKTKIERGSRSWKSLFVHGSMLWTEMDSLIRSFGKICNVEWINPCGRFSLSSHKFAKSYKFYKKVTGVFKKRASINIARILEDREGELIGKLSYIQAGGSLSSTLIDSIAMPYFNENYPNLAKGGKFFSKFLSKTCSFISLWLTRNSYINYNKMACELSKYYFHPQLTEGQKVLATLRYLKELVCISEKEEFRLFSQIQTFAKYLDDEKKMKLYEEAVETLFKKKKEQFTRKSDKRFFQAFAISLRENIEKLENLDPGFFSAMDTIARSSSLYDEKEPSYKFLKKHLLISKKEKNSLIKEIKMENKDLLSSEVQQKVIDALVVLKQEKFESFMQTQGIQCEISQSFLNDLYNFASSKEMIEVFLKETTSNRFWTRISFLMIVLSLAIVFVEVFLVIPALIKTSLALLMTSYWAYMFFKSFSKAIKYESEIDPLGDLMPLALCSKDSLDNLEESV
ncbi:MAG TPA: hypothetical protein P5048_01380 [Chlamydiales bacterium]|nr:hypothetical protein [Chlamydiales bacterium]